MITSKFLVFVARQTQQSKTGNCSQKKKKKLQSVVNWGKKWFENFNISNAKLISFNHHSEHFLHAICLIFSAQYHLTWLISNINRSSQFPAPIFIRGKRYFNKNQLLFFLGFFFSRIKNILIKNSFHLLRWKRYTQ